MPQISTVLGVAVPAEREDSAWSEGVAIWVAVLVVSLVGEPASQPASQPAMPVSQPGMPAGPPATPVLLPLPAPPCWHHHHCHHHHWSLALPPPPPHSLPPPTPLLLAGAFNDWNKDRQFQKLNAQKDIIEVKVIRGGQQLTITNTDVVVGDLMLLDTGDKIIADGYTTEVGAGALAGAGAAGGCWWMLAPVLVLLVGAGAGAGGCCSGGSCWC